MYCMLIRFKMILINGNNIMRYKIAAVKKLKKLEAMRSRHNARDTKC